MSESAVLRPSPSYAQVRAEPSAFVVGLLCLWWTLMVFEPERFVARTVGVSLLYRTPLVLMPLVGLLALQRGGARVIYWPLVFFLGVHVLGVFHASNIGFPLIFSRSLVYMLVTTMAVLCLSNSPERLTVLLKLYLLAFGWYGVQGIPQGLVGWHHELSNEDSYGPLMGIGFGFAYYMALAIPSRAWKMLGIAIAVVCCVGVVASFARGALISFAAAVGILWLRSPNKLGALVAGAVGLMVAVVAASVLFPAGAFWEEMQTIFSEGTSSGTGMVRWVMWGMAMELWLDQPLLGVGAGNFGVTAAETLPDDPDRPAFGSAYRLWSMALHNSYIQILCEQGIVGSILFLWMVWVFFRCIRRLRRPEAAETWRERGGVINLRLTALGLEVGMAAYLLNAVFYNQLYVHWFWSLLALAIGLNRCVGDGAPAAVRSAEVPVPPGPVHLARPAAAQPLTR